MKGIKKMKKIVPLFVCLMGVNYAHATSTLEEFSPDQLPKRASANDESEKKANLSEEEIYNVLLASAKKENYSLKSFKTLQKERKFFVKEGDVIIKLE